MMVEAEKLVSIHSGGACATVVERSKGPLEFSMVERPAPHLAFHILVAVSSSSKSFRWLWRRGNVMFSIINILHCMG